MGEHPLIHCNPRDGFELGDIWGRLGAESSGTWAIAVQKSVLGIDESDAIAFGPALCAITLALASSGLRLELTIFKLEAINSVVPNRPIVRSIRLRNVSSPF